MDTLDSLVIESLSTINSPRHHIYEEMISHCFSAFPPPFSQNWFGRRYFELSRNADWFANSLIANATLEGYGSQQIWKFSNKVSNEKYAEGLRKHSLDESRHSSIFILMLHLIFPGMDLDDSTKNTLDSIQPKFSLHKHPPIEIPSFSSQYSDEKTLNELVQVHITEIRALVLQYLLRETLIAYSPENTRKKVVKLSDSLIRDEARHIEYTASFFEEAAHESKDLKDFLYNAFERNTKSFNDLTMVEFEREKIGI